MTILGHARSDDPRAAAHGLRYDDTPDEPAAPEYAPGLLRSLWSRLFRRPAL